MDKLDIFPFIYDRVIFIPVPMLYDLKKLYLMVSD